MKFLIIVPLALTLTALACTLTASACSIRNSKVTFYGFPENDPPGAAIAFNCGRGYTAGGTGTYSDPLTFASAPEEYTECEIVYLPYLKKYLRFEDSCLRCTTNWNIGLAHINVWTGSSTSNGGTKQTDCENALAAIAKQGVVRQPSHGLTVDKTALFKSGTCSTSHTYANNKATC